MKIASLAHNIPLIYFLTALNFSWFWTAIWVLFYLRFTDYAGVGLLESVMIVTMVAGEIPTGAVADLLGKTKTLTLAYLVCGIGFILIGLSDTFVELAISVVIASLGGTFTSGTVEALTYDSLASLKRENHYERVLGNISTVKMCAFAVSSIVGGLMYSVHPGLPFIALGITDIVAMLLSLLLIEPPVDSEIFSWRNYLNQTKAGFLELFKNAQIRTQSLLLMLLAMIVGMNIQVLIDVQLVALGWQEKQLGVIMFILFVMSAIFSQLSKLVSSKIGNWTGSIVVALMVALTMVAVPLLGVLLATAIVMVRNGLILLFENASSAVINQNTHSKVRATTLSTFNMLANIPYVLSAYYLGYLMDFYSPHTVVWVLGSLLLLISLGGIVYIRWNRKQSFT